MCLNKENRYCTEIGKRYSYTSRGKVTESTISEKGYADMKRLSFMVMLAVCLCAGLALAVESPVGKWNTIDEKTGKVTSQVEVYLQEGKLCGKIVSLPDPNDKNGKPLVCAECTGDDKDKPIVGLVIMKNLSLQGERYKGGSLLDPDDGKVYTAEVWVEDGTLKVRGFVGIFRRTQTWIRAK